MKEDDLIEVKIEDIGSDGEGIGKVDGFTLFIKDAIIGDTVEAKVMKMKKSYGYARLQKVLVPSSWRIEARCPVARQCGGCQIQEMAYSEQLRYKENKVHNNLKRIGGFDDIVMEPIIGMEEPFFYRNKAQYPVGQDKMGNLVTGFYAGRTHNIINHRQCLLGPAVNEQILNIVLDFMTANHIPAYNEIDGSGVVRHVLIRNGFATGQIMVCLIINQSSLPHAKDLVDRLQEISCITSICINVNMEHTNVILGKKVKVLWGQHYIEDYIGDIKYQISPLSFFQVNPVQTEKLYKTALEYAGLMGNETVWDLYCGIGTISLFLAQKAGKVYGVEMVPAAITDAQRNAQINGIENVEFYVGRAEEVLPEKYAGEGILADVIVVDPPRKGCDETLLQTMAEMAPKRIVYVSCDSATLARDMRYLCDRGYELVRCRAVDMFGGSVHVECVALLMRKGAEKA